MKWILSGSFVLLSFAVTAQIDSTFLLKLKSIEKANSLQRDTAAVPDDALTKKIKLLRSKRSGLTTETVLKIKILEEGAKDTARKQFYAALMDEVTSGRTSQLIEKALINLYRRYFTEPEIDELIRFYGTPAGKKMDTEFIFLMLQSVKDGEELLKLASSALEAKEKKTSAH